jgi:hypothetical protein
VYLINVGCDTLYVDSLRFDDGSFLTPTVQPFVVKPNDSTPVVIRISPDTNGARHTIFGHLIIFSQASILKVQNVLLTLPVLYPEMITMDLVGGPAKGHSGDEVSYELVLATKPKEARTISFAVTTDDDILDSLSFSGSGLVFDSSSRNASGVVIRYFTISVSATTDTVAHFSYKVILADSSTTSVDLSHMSAANANGLPGACVTSLAGQGISFTYDPHCGEDKLSKFMATGQLQLSIEDPQPNPARNSITLRLRTNSDLTDQPVTVHVFDLLGRIVESATQSTNIETFDISSLADGVYYVEATLGNVRAAKQLVVQR